ncbi:hypothetical protein AALP_AA1G263900 [Arabis alpina]|uniref:CRIB domain-containing protein n=1 Tax=Arabis alpina TaxID=50452 RepID=A0A087HQT8_ARAAL|nr:hypothetical protein AALP_AA1G263900 [Arabis alpina]
MKDRMERFVVLPFSLGCSTQSCVAVASTTTHQHKKPNQLIKKREESDEYGSFRKEETKIDNNNGANISDSIYKIIRSLKSLSHFFIRYEEEREVEIEIGFPTDVKHLSHIGVDGTMTTFDLTSSPSFPFSGFHLTAV